MNKLCLEDLFKSLYHAEISCEEDYDMIEGIVEDLQIIVSKIGECLPYENTLEHIGYKHCVLDIIKYLEAL